MFVWYTQPLHWATFNITEKKGVGGGGVRDGHCPRRAWTCYEEMRGREEERWWYYLFVKCFSHVALLCPEQRGLEREIMWLGSHGERLSTVRCQLIAQDRTLQVPYSQEAATNDVLQLGQGQQRWREANTRMNLHHRSSNRCAQTDRWIARHTCTHSWKETRNINWNTQHEVSWPFSLPRGL